MRKVIVGFAALAAVLAAPAMAGFFSVSPISVHLDPGGRAGTVELRNDGADPTVVQVQAYDWVDRQDVNELVPSGKLLAAPPVFELGPGETQVVRLALRRPLDGATEQAYRLVITEVPDEVRGNAVAVALQLSLPVFVTPAGAAPEPVWTARRLADGDGELRLINRGAAHVEVRDLRLADERGGRPLLDTETGERVLAGRQRTWRFDASGLSPSAQLRLNAATNAGEVDVLVPLQSG